MKARYLLGIALAAATAVAACGGGATDTLEGDRDPTPGGGSSSGSAGKPKVPGSSSGSTAPPGDTSNDPAGPTGPVNTNSPAGQAYFDANVHPVLQAKCGACHTMTGPGQAWFAVDKVNAYSQLFKMGYVVQQSRIIIKPAHGGVTNNVLSGAEITTYNTWVGMELKDGGTKAPPAVLDKIGGCFDKAKFDAMQLGQWRTTRRTNDNNTNNITPWNENANNCTGCNNAPCTTCHSADPATNFNNAVGNTLLPAETTFENTKLATPAYVTKYFGVSPDGKAIASDGIKKKSDATKKDKAYTHPMYQLNANQQAALDAFVLDAVTKFNAGTCGGQ